MDFSKMTFKQQVFWASVIFFFIITGVYWDEFIIFLKIVGVVILLFGLNFHRSMVAAAGNPIGALPDQGLLLIVAGIMGIAVGAFTSFLRRNH